MVETKNFNLHNGKSFSTVKSLAKELKNMSTEVYKHHVSPLKNDFANWLKNSVRDEVLAKRVDGHINKIEMELEILRHLIHSNSKKKIIKKKIINATSKVK